MKRFKDKIIIVTGGVSGIGKAGVEAFLKEGGKVVIGDFDDKGKAYSDELNKQGFDTMFVKTDVTEETQVENLVNETVKRYGRLDVMFANAGIANDAPIAELSKEKWDKTIAINLSGVFFCDKHAIIQMLKQGGGVIVNTGSIHSIVGQIGLTAYCAAKGGVRLLTYTGSLNYAKDNIRINTVCPGYIDTPLLKPDVMPDEKRNWLSSLHPVGRMGTAEEVANVVLFLASDDASFVSGACLLVDGGYVSQ